MKPLLIHTCGVAAVLLASSWALAQTEGTADSAAEIPQAPAEGAQPADAVTPAPAPDPAATPAPAPPPPTGGVVPAPAAPATDPGPVMPATVAPAPAPAPGVVIVAPSGPPPLRPFQVSVLVEIPIFLDVPSDVVRPGGGIFGSFGYVLKETFVPFAGFGYTGNPIDLAEYDDSMEPEPIPDIREPLNRFWFSVGIQVQQRFGDVMPYASFAADFNAWHFLEMGYTCGWYCGGYPQYRFTPGFSARAGLQYSADERGRFNIDIGLKFGYTGPGDFFEDTELWLSPYVGLTFRP